MIPDEFTLPSEAHALTLFCVFVGLLCLGLAVVAAIVAVTRARWHRRNVEPPEFGEDLED